MISPTISVLIMNTLTEAQNTKRYHQCKRPCLHQGSHYFVLTKFHDISRFFKVNFQIFFSLFLKYDFQVVLNINMQTY